MSKEVEDLKDSRELSAKGGIRKILSLLSVRQYSGVSSMPLQPLDLIPVASRLMALWESCFWFRTQEDE